ncbi:alpha/beta fold hydrolase [Mycolicibacterium chlorophenolicum]|uniref:alpha/beta fold hydrolase n=1 Tax=Mycolicibacterium chlorophenolicum TaxID=37916 RepID=UPI001300CE60|nr:alpha/beta fold hydrolase [Mycolicibacterium chlorophenolicum]
MGSAAVFIHGIFSSQDVWQPLLTQLQQLPDVGERYAFPKFEYSSKKVVVNRMRRRPDLDALADWLRTFLEHQCREHDELVLVGHSQGGLVIQRFLARMLDDGRGHDLRRIRAVVLLACPNDGSDFMMSTRRTILRSRNVQELQLRPNSEPVKAAQARVLNQIVNAPYDSDRFCRIPFHVFYGLEDGVVPVASARGPFAEPRALPGDHSTILSATNPTSAVVTVVRNILVDAVRKTLPPTEVTPDGGAVDVERGQLDLSSRHPPASRQATSHQVVVGEIPGLPPAFITRNTLTRLSQSLDRNLIAVVCALTGMRGVGKTQLAAAYARSKIVEGCGVVGWVNAETVGEMVTGLARIAERLNVADPKGDSAESARRLTEHLASTRVGDALLVFDNATDPDELKKYIPPVGTRVVITSTSRSFTELGTPIDVSEYTPEESISYLTQRTGLDDQAGASRIAEELGHLPLALSSAAATIKARRLDYGAYFALLQERTVVEIMPRREGGGYPRSIAAALMMNVDAVVSSDPGGICSTVIGTIALLSPEGVPRALLRGISDSTHASTGAIDDALAQCVDGSVLSWSFSGDAVIMHRLMARVLWERYRADGTFSSLASGVLDLIEPELFDSSEAWSRRNEGSWLVSHAEALWEALQEDDVS